ncbi:MAG: sulfatase-like hydrolase/transferase, partial [Bacteroidota bacterium]
MRYLLPFFLTIVLSCAQPTPTTTPNRSPNVLLILADDMGFSDLGCYGSQIETPHLDRLAKEGVRFSNFYNCAKCTPSRGSLLTGRYPHRAGVGSAIAMPDKNYKKGAYQGYLESSIPNIANFFRENGYQTGMSGKWHLGEREQHWPMNYGFDSYYGLISGASSYFEKVKEKRNRRFVQDSTEFTPPSKDWYFTDEIADHAIEHITRFSQAGQPFVEYVAFTAPHWPLHALDKDIQKYAGKYDQGWAATRQARHQKLQGLGVLENVPELPLAPETISAWDERDTTQAWARRMEVHAAMVDNMDQNIGRLLATLENLGQLENTIVLFLSDNGASAEDITGRKLHNPDIPIGQQGSFLSFCEPWANVSNVPFYNYKLRLYEGGIASPLIVHYPKSLANKIAPQAEKVYHAPVHIMDIFPTMIDWTVGLQAADRQTLGLDGNSINQLLTSKEKRSLFWEYRK